MVRQPHNPSSAATASPSTANRPNPPSPSPSASRVRAPSAEGLLFLLLSWDDGFLILARGPSRHCRRCPAALRRQTAHLHPYTLRRRGSQRRGSQLRGSRPRRRHSGGLCILRRRTRKRCLGRACRFGLERRPERAPAADPATPASVSAPTPEPKPEPTPKPAPETSPQQEPESTGEPEPEPDGEPAPNPISSRATRPQASTPRLPRHTHATGRSCQEPCAASAGIGQKPRDLNS